MKHFRLWIVALLVTFTSNFQFGYHTTYVNTALDAFKKFVNDSYDYSLTEQEFSIRWTLASNMFIVGCVLGVFLTPYSAETFGRRNSIIFSTIPALIATAVLCISVKQTSYALFCIGRILIGISSGISGNVQTTYLVECSPVEIRGKVNCLPEIQLLFMAVVGFFVGLPSILGQAAVDYWKFYVIYAIGAIPAVIPLCYFALPESPKFLYLKRKNADAALKSIRYFSGKSVQFEEIFRQYLEEQEQDEHVTFRVGLKYVLKYRKAIFIGTLATTMVNFTGSWATYSFSTKIFTTAGISSDLATYATVVMSIIGLMASFVALFLVEKAGRRPLMLGSFAGCLIFGSLYATASLLHKNFELHWCSYVALIAVILHSISFDLGVGPIGWCFAQEITPQSCRSHAGSISLFFSWVVVYANGVGFYPLFELLDAWAFLIIFMGPLMVGLAILWRMMPESKGKTTKEILQTMGYTKVEPDAADSLVENVVLKF